jgi:AcrR family transcriptional regulator
VPIYLYELRPIPGHDEEPVPVTTDISARTRILNTADQLFYQRGFHAVGVDEIVARSQVAKTTLYAHFKSKDVLIAAYLQRQSDNWQRILETRLREFPGTPAQAIDFVFSLIEAGCAETSFRGCPYINFAVEIPDRSHPGWEVCLNHRRWLHQVLRGLAAAGGASEPDALAEQLCLLYDASMVGSLFDGTGRSATVMRDTASMLVQAAFPSEPLRPAVAR